MNEIAFAFDIGNVFQPAKIPGYGDSTGFGQLAGDVITILISVAGAAAIIFIIIGGIKLITSSGDEKKLASAQGTITYAIIGLAVTALAFIILQIVQFLLKSKVPV